MSASQPSVAVLGGTGDLGSGLALQLARAGYAVTVGSRSADRAEAAAAALRENVGGARVGAGDNREAAAEADVVILTVPFSSHDATVESVRDAVQGRIFVDATVPLVPPKVMRVQLPEGGSVATRARQLLGDGVRVVSAFQNVAAAHLRGDDPGDTAGDVLVTGDDPEARELVIGIARSIGLQAWHAGPLENSVVAESLTPILIFLNRKYGLDGAGIRIIGTSKEKGNG